MIIVGDCRAVMAGMEPDSVDAIVNRQHLIEAMRCIDFVATSLNKSAGEWRRKRTGANTTNEEIAAACEKRVVELRAVYDALCRSLQRRAEQ